MEPKRLNVGLIGLGFIGKMHATAYRDIPLCFPEPKIAAELKAVLRSRLDGELEFVRSINPGLVTTKPEEFYNQDLDIVDVCSPNYLHLEQVQEALNHKQHVYCEKPLASTLAEARLLAERARQAGVFTQVAFIFRYLPAVRQMKALIDAGELGEIFHFRTRMFHASYLDTNRPMSWRLRRETSGGGSLMDLGAHLIDMAHYLLGETATVHADMRTLIKQRPLSKGSKEMGIVDVDDWANVTLEMKSGAVGLVEVTRMAAGAGEDTTFEIFGSKGSLSFAMAQPDNVRFYSLKNQRWQIGFQDVPTLQGERPIEQLWPNTKFSQGMMTNAHLASAFNFMHCVAEGKPSTIDFDMAVRAQEVEEAAYLSAQRNGEKLTLPL